MKKTIISIATSALLATSAFSAECTGFDNLFPFEDISSNSVLDVNGDLEKANGKVNSALKFDGKSYLSASDTNFSNFSDDFSIVTFIKTNAKSMSQSIIDKREDNLGYHLFLNSPATSESTLALEINGVNFGNPNGEKLNDNKWHCVAVSVDRDANNGGQFYIDGVASHNFDPTVVNQDSSNNANLLIGSATPNHPFSSKFKGTIDEVVFASTVLTPEQINCLCDKSAIDEESEDLPLIPLVEENSITINHQFEQDNPALAPVLDLEASKTGDINKNDFVALSISTVNVKDVNLSASDDSVYFKQEGDIVYASFTKSGDYEITLQGYDNSGNLLSDNVDFSINANTAPTGSDNSFDIKSSEVLKFDGNSYFQDIDGDFLTFAVEGDLPKGNLQINNNLIVFTPDKESYNTSFSLKATDPDGESAIANFNVNVTFTSDIELLRGWNLIGNSLSDKAINTSAILETDEVIYTFGDTGFWEMSDLTYNTKDLKPKEGLWIKVTDDRGFSIDSSVPNALTDSTQKTVNNGWNLLAETKEVALRELKYGYDKVFVYDKKENSWLNSTTNPNYILKEFNGYWGRAVDVVENNGTIPDNNETTPENQAPDMNQLNVAITSQNSGVSVNDTIENINLLNFETDENVTFNFSNILGTDSDTVTLSIDNSFDNLTFDKDLTNIAENDTITLTTPTLDGNYSFRVVVTDSSNLSSYKDIQFSATTNNQDNFVADGTLVRALSQSTSQIIGDYVYLLGGATSYNSPNNNKVYRAPVSNPTLWEETNQDLFSDLASSTSQIIGDFVYLFGGNYNVIYRASTTDPIVWEDTGAILPDRLYESTSQIIGDFIYIFTGMTFTGTGYSNKIYRAPVSDPTSWVDTNKTSIINMYDSSSEIIGEYIYFFGGRTGSHTHESSIYKAPVSDPTNWSDTNADLPYGLSASTSQVIGNFVYLFGGLADDSATDKIFRAPITDPTNWEELNIVLPTTLYHSTSQVIGAHVYLFGGYGGGKNRDSIYKIPITTLEN